MPIPTYEAAPLAKTFLVSRALQLICFFGIIGITASFISDIVSTNHVVPIEIVGTIVVVSLPLSSVDCKNLRCDIDASSACYKSSQS